LSDSVPLKKVIDRIIEGTIRIPGFQRKFVWEPDRAALLMDSIFKGYPFGSVLLWYTRTELKTEKSLGGFNLPAPVKDYPINYVLDGQQRLTSIFTALQTELPAPAEDPEVWLPVYYDFGAKDDAQESRFVALAAADVDPDRHHPLRPFFDPVEFYKSVDSLSEARKIEIVGVQAKFQSTMIPTDTFESEDRTRVAIVFERVNRMGVDLDIFELLTAWTWSEDFDLQDRFNELSEEFETFGFQDIGSDKDLMLRCTSAILKGDPAPTAMIDINGSEVRDQFERVSVSLRLAVDFLRSELEVRHIKFLPYTAQLIPLAAYFSIDQSKSVPKNHRQKLLRWFWRSSFSRRYSGNPGRNILNDVGEAVKLRAGDESSLDGIGNTIEPDFFLENVFNSRTVATKAAILMLAGEHPRSFISGNRVDLDVVMSEPNLREYHHCVPKAFLKANHPGMSDKRVSSLANMAIISRSDNREISGRAPSEYRGVMPEDISAIAASAFLPDSLWADDPEKFMVERAALMYERAAALTA